MHASAHTKTNTHTRSPKFSLPSQSVLRQNFTCVHFLTATVGSTEVTICVGYTSSCYCQLSCEVLGKMTKFMQTYSNTNIAIISIAHRFDVDNESRTNLAIQKINSKLKKMTKLFRHVSMIEMESNRKDYMKHGLHLNKAGKEGLARSIANLINQIVLRENKEKQVITLNWKEEVNMDISVQMSPEQHKHRHLEVTDIISNRTSTRPKKTTYYKEK